MTRQYFLSLLRDNLSSVTWTQCKKALIGNELISIGADIIYAYQAAIDRYYLQGYSTISTTVVPKSQLRSNVIQKFNDISLPPGVVREALIDYFTEVIYQCYMVIDRHKKANLYSNCATYRDLLQLARRQQVPVPVSDVCPGSITVQIPSGNLRYKPYELCIQMGNAGFYNLSDCQSGDQVNLYLGTPYCYVGQGEDVSPFPSCMDYSSTVRVSPNIYSCVDLPSNTFIESVRVFSQGTSLVEYNRFRYGVSATNCFRVVPAMDGSYEVAFGDFYSGQTSYSASIPTQDWCIRFLKLQNVEFTPSDVNLPDGFKIVSWKSSSVKDLDYAKLTYAHFGYEHLRTASLISDAMRYFPTIFDISISNSSTSALIKPTVPTYLMLLKEEEEWLHNNGRSGVTCYCCLPRKVRVNLRGSSSHPITDITLSQRSKFAQSLVDQFGYEKMGITSTIARSDVESLKTAAGISDNYNTGLQISQKSLSSSVALGSPIYPTGIRVYSDGDLIASDCKDSSDDNIGRINYGAQRLFRGTLARTSIVDNTMIGQFVYGTGTLNYDHYFTDLSSMKSVKVSNTTSSLSVYRCCGGGACDVGSSTPTSVLFWPESLSTFRSITSAGISSSGAITGSWGISINDVDMKAALAHFYGNPDCSRIAISKDGTYPRGYIAVADPDNSDSSNSSIVIYFGRITSSACGSATKYIVPLPAPFADLSVIGSDLVIFSIDGSAMFVKNAMASGWPSGSDFLSFRCLKLLDVDGNPFVDYSKNSYPSSAEDNVWARSHLRNCFRIHASTNGEIAFARLVTPASTYDEWMSRKYQIYIASGSKDCTQGLYLTNLREVGKPFCPAYTINMSDSTADVNIVQREGSIICGGVRPDFCSFLITDPKVNNTAEAADYHFFVKAFIYSNGSLNVVGPFNVSASPSDRFYPGVVLYTSKNSTTSFTYSSGTIVSDSSLAGSDVIVDLTYADGSDAKDSNPYYVMLDEDNLINYIQS